MTVDLKGLCDIAYRDGFNLDDMSLNEEQLDIEKEAFLMILCDKYLITSEKDIETISQAWFAGRSARKAEEVNKGG